MSAKPLAGGAYGPNVVSASFNKSLGPLSHPPYSQGAPPPPPPNDPGADARALTKAVHNEQVKLRATGLNTVGVGFIVAGVITPLTLAGAGSGSVLVNGQTLALMAIWTVCASVLHMTGTLVLRNTR